MSSDHGLDYNMNIDFQDLAVNDPESRGLRAFGLGERNDQVRGFRIVRPLDVAL